MFKRMVIQLLKQYLQDVQQWMRWDRSGRLKKTSRSPSYPLRPTLNREMLDGAAGGAAPGGPWRTAGGTKLAVFDLREAGLS
jgi:hypothetical protein